MEQQEQQPVKKKSNRNRSAGHQFELDCRDQFKTLGFPHVVSTRSESRSRDNKGIDLINRDESENGRLPFDVQCKNSSSHQAYAKLIVKMGKIPGVIPVVLHKMTARGQTKVSTGKNLIVQDHYAIIRQEDFFKLVADSLELQRLKQQQNVSTH